MALTADKKSLPNAQISLTGSIPVETIRNEWESALSSVTQTVSLPGFRKGHAPKELVIAEYGKRALWREAASRTMERELPALLTLHKVQPIVPVELSLITPEADEPATFTIIATGAPTCTITGYSETAAQAAAAVSAPDTDEMATALRAFRTQSRAIGRLQSATPGDAAAIESAADTPLTDDEAQPLGFETGAAFETFIQGEAEKAVSDRALQKKRGAIADALIASATAAIPIIMIQEEVGALLESMKRNVAEKMPWPTYLIQSGKTEDAIRAELTPTAEKRIILEGVFAVIAEKESLTLTPEDVAQEEKLAHAIQHEGVSHDAAHTHARTMLIREKVWSFLGAPQTRRTD